MSLIIEIIVAFFATSAFAILFSIPGRQWVFCGITGAVGWMFYRIFSIEYGIVIATFLAVLILTFLSRIFSVTRKAPVTLFLVAGIFPLVPGVGIYYTSYYFIMGELSKATEKGTETVKLAIAIALGIMCILSIPQKAFNCFLRPSKSS